MNDLNISTDAKYVDVHYYELDGALQYYMRRENTGWPRLFFVTARFRNLYCLDWYTRAIKRH